MARVIPDARSKQAWALAAAQHGVVSRRQLIDIGWSEEAVEHRIAKGRLHRILAGVYAVGWPDLTDERRWIAAVLGCEPEAALSHHSAAALWGFGRERRDRVDVSVRRRCEHRLSGIRARSRPALPEEDVVVRRGIPVTHPARTLLDQAAELGAMDLERAVNDADKLGLITPEELREELGGFRGQPGVRALRNLLDRHVFVLSDSDLEVLFRPIAASAGLPRPETKVWVNGFEVDFFWPELGLVVETDGLRYHRTPSAQARDHVRDQTHIATGLTTLRFTHRQVKHEPAYVSRVLSHTARQLGAPGNEAQADLPGPQHG